LIGDTKTLLSHWDVGSSVDENIRRVQRDNVFGKASRSRVEAILAIFRQRYLKEESVTQALVTLVQNKFPLAALEPLFYFHSARADRLLRDAVTEILVPMQARGLVDIKVQDFERPLAEVVLQAPIAPLRQRPIMGALDRLLPTGAWLHQTARCGFVLARAFSNVRAQTGVGLALYNGRGITQNKEEAAKWFAKAADQNFSDLSIVASVERIASAIPLCPPPRNLESEAAE
jgi:hypothetical protein